MSAPAGSRERSESRLGFFLAAAVALLVAGLFAARVVERPDLAAIDYFFTARPDPPRSPDIMMIYFDDVAARQRKRVRRDDTARVLRALTRFGARMVMLDVEYVSDFSRAGEAGDDGRLPLDDDTRFLARALQLNGRTLVNVNYERPLEHIDPALARQVIDRLKARLALEPRDLDLGARERADVDSAFANLRQHAANERVGEILAAEPGLSYKEVRGRLLTIREIETRDGAVADILRAYHALRVLAIIGRRNTPVESLGLPPDAREQGLLRPMIPEFAERVLSAGHATTYDRDTDGVLRRAPTVIRTPSGPALYTGLEVAAKALEDDAHRVSLRLEAGAVTLEQVKRDGGDITRRVRIPLESTGLTLADWGTPFDSLSFAKFLDEDLRQTKLLMTNLGRCVEKLAEISTPEQAAALRSRTRDLSARWTRAETDLDAPISEMAEVEEATKRFAAELSVRLKEEAERQRASIAKVPPRQREGLQAVITRCEQLVQDLAIWQQEDPEVRRRVQGRICFFGSKATETGDLYSTPMSPQTAGVDLHANVAAMVFRGRITHVAPAWMNFVLIAAVGLAVSAGVSSWTLFRGALFTVALMAASIVLFAVVALRSGLMLSGAGPSVCGFATFTVAVSWRELVARRSQRRLQKELARHTSPDLVSIIMADPERFSRPRQTTATIFFSDIKGFTGIGEKMDAEQLVRFMNRYHDRMTQILMDRRAYLDKYIGDGIMALFGVPVETPDHARLACYAALENVAAANRLSEEFQREGLPAISIRVGLNSGSIVAAYVGASDRADYTAIGDAVNLASRLEGANKGYGSAIMASESTYRLAKDAFRFRELDLIRVVGKKQGIRVYELLGQRDQPDPFPEGFLAAYHEGISAFEAREWPKAREHFDRALAIMPDDKPAKIYATRCSGFELSPPPRDWDGVFDLSEK